MPPDDASIADGEDLLRRIHPEWLVQDDNLGRRRPSSQAFEDSPDGSSMSVMLAAKLAEDGRPPEDALRGHPTYFLAAITAGLARQLQQGIVRDPLPEEPAHAMVVGRKTKSIRKRFAAEARWIVEPG